MKIKIIVPILICTLTAGLAFWGYSVRTVRPAAAIAPKAHMSALDAFVYGPPTAEGAIKGKVMSEIIRGSSGVVLAESADGTSFDWEIFDSGFASVANSDTPNGWDATARSNSQCTVHVPSDATIATGYLIVWFGDTGDYYGHFDVIAGRPKVTQGWRQKFEINDSGGGDSSNTWIITDADDIAVASGALGAADSGWKVSFSTPNATVEAPYSAVVKTGYKLQVLTTNDLRGTFDVVARAYGLRRRLMLQQDV